MPHSRRWAELEWDSPTQPTRLSIRFSRFTIDTVLYSCSGVARRRFRRGRSPAVTRSVRQSRLAGKVILAGVLLFFLPSSLRPRP